MGLHTCPWNQKEAGISLLGINTLHYVENGNI